MEAWHILITIGIIAFIFEIFTAGFISASPRWRSLAAGAQKTN
jgi:hypothetical protein